MCLVLLTIPVPLVLEASLVQLDHAAGPVQLGSLDPAGAHRVLRALQVHLDQLVQQDPAVQTAQSQVQLARLVQPVMLGQQDPAVQTAQLLVQLVQAEGLLDQLDPLVLD